MILQIHDSWPTTLPHPEIARYFMTLPETAQLVMQAGAMAKGIEIVQIMDAAVEQALATNPSNSIQPVNLSSTFLPEFI